MASRTPILLLLGLLPSVTSAGILEAGNPPGLHALPGLAIVHVAGQASWIRLTPRHGHARLVHLPRPAALDEPLALPPGDWADLTLILDAPIQVSVDRGPPLSLDLPELTVPLEDPGASAVTLTWTLPDGLASALRSGVLPSDLRAALEDGALAGP